MANGLPDPQGAIGYANVFRGNKSIDDWRDDLLFAKREKLRKENLKDVDRKQLLAGKFIGWGDRDQPELNEAFQTFSQKVAQEGWTPENQQTKNMLLALAEQSVKHQEEYDAARKYLETNKKELDPEEYEQAWIDLENWASAGGKATKAGGIWERGNLDKPSLPEKQTDWRPSYEAMRRGVRGVINEKWNPNESMTVKTKQFLEGQMDAEFNPWINSDYGKSAIKDYQREAKRSGKEITYDEAKESVYKDFKDSFANEYKEAFKYPPQGRGGFELNIGGGGASKTGLWSHVPQKFTSQSARQYLGKNFPINAPDPSSAIDYSIFDGAEAVSEQFIGSATNMGREQWDVSSEAIIIDKEGNRLPVDKAYPSEYRPSFTVRDKNGDYWTIGTASYTASDGKSEKATVIDKLNDVTKPQYEHAFYTDHEQGKSATLEEIFGKEPLEIDVKAGTVKPSQQPEDYVTSILNFEKSKGYDNFGFTSEPKGSIKTIEQAKAKFNKEYLPLIKDLPLPLQAVAGDFAFNSEDPRASLMVAAGFITPEEKKKLYVNGKLDKAKVDKLWNASGDGGFGRVGNEYAGDPQGFLDAFDKERIRSYENTKGADEHLDEWKERVAISRKQANKLLEPKPSQSSNKKKIAGF